MATNRKLLEVVAILAAYPLEQDGLTGSSDNYPILGNGEWKLLVGHVRRAREALEEERAGPCPDADGFIPWNGGERPLDTLAQVVVRFRNNVESLRETACDLDWEHGDYYSPTSSWDIVAYRMAK